MARRSWAMMAGIFLCVCVLAGAAFWYYTGTRAFMEQAGAMAAEKASEALGVRVDTATVRLDSLRALSIDDIAVYDKQGELIAKAESARVGFSFFGVLTGNAVKAVETVEINRPEAWISERPDGGWNYQDLIAEDSEPSEFAGRVSVKEGRATLRSGGHTLLLADLAGSIDMSDAAAPEVKAHGRSGTAVLDVSGHLGDDLHLQLEGQAIHIDDYLEWLPADLLPESVTVRSGRIDQLTAEVRRDEDGAFSGQGQVALTGGAVRVLDTEIYGIAGLAELEDKRLSVDLTGMAGGQKAAVRGDIFLGGEEPALDLYAESPSFDPSRVMTDIPFQGAVAFAAQVAGTTDNPVVEGEFRAASGEVYDFAFHDAAAQAAYADGRIAVHSLTASALGGQIQAAGEFEAADLRYDGRVQLYDIDLSELSEYLPDVSGRLFADLGLAGQGKDFSAFSVFGSVAATDASYGGIAIPVADASFFRADGVTTLDFVSLGLPGNGEMGVQGTIGDDGMLDLFLLGSQVDLSLLATLEPTIDVTGSGDFLATVRGEGENPEVAVDITAIDGKLFQQPYQSLHCIAAGSLDRVSVESFSMENGSGINWLVQGTAGFSGDRRLNLQIDTMGVRMEDIAALVAPDQPITGNVDNIVTIGGTLDNPSVTGYVHFYRGSYGGYILSGMDGDYTMKNGILTLQDFHIFSPLVDMDLNGTIAVASRELDLTVVAQDIDLLRFGGKLPYPISGHGRFNGHISGTLATPAFDGSLTADELVFNGETITNANGRVTLQGNRVTFEPLHFEQNGGTYSMRAWTNIASQAMNGHVEVKNGDINAIMAVTNLKNDVVNGRADGTIEISGTLQEPAADVDIVMEKGDIGGYPVTGVQLNGTLRNRVITLERFAGRQGEGSFAATGQVDLDGIIDGRFSAQKINAGLLTAAAGSSLSLSGALDLEMQFGGTVDVPTADASLTITSGGFGTSAFDTVSGLCRLRGGAIHVDQFLIQKAQGGHAYKASAYGLVPLKALTSNLGESLAADDQIDLQLSLDEADLGILPVMSKEIDWALGATYGKLHIGGTLAAPRLNGTLGVREGAVKLHKLALPFTDVALGLKFEDDTISVSDGTGKLGNGTFGIAGSVRLDGQTPVDYNLHAEADKLDIQAPFYKGPFSATLDLTEGQAPKSGRVLPKLAGRFVIDNARISVPTIPESEGELPEVLLDLGIEFGKNTHFYSSRLYDLWLSGSIRYDGSTKYLRPSGSVSVRRGSVTYIQTKFTIRQGDAYFNQVGSFLPSVQFRADTRLNKTKIMLSVSGPVEAMKLSLTSSPAMSHEELLRVLTLRGNYQSGQEMSNADMTSALLGVGLQMSVLGTIEDAMRDFLQLDELMISQDMEERKKKGDNQDKEAYNITIGKYITDKIMLRYTHGINHDRHRYSIRYDFDDRFSVVAGHNTEHNNNWIGIESRIRF